MAVYGWVPFTDTGCQVSLIYTISNNIVGQLSRCLPMADGSPSFPGMLAGSWSQIVENDTLVIAAHGALYSTNVVGWIIGGGDEIIKWTATQLAQAIWVRLGSARSSLNICYNLVACFGANNMTFFAASFGSKLAMAMKKLNMHGMLTADKGATGMGKLVGEQRGISRTTYGLSYIFPGVTSLCSRTGNSKKIWTL